MTVGAMPTSFDWSKIGMVTPAKDQGACGSCWAFASTGVFESKLMMMGEPVYDLSEEQQVSCNSSMSGCNGGNMNALRFWFDRGPMEENCTGYKSSTTAIPPCSERDKCGELLYRTYDYYTVNATVNDIKTTIYNDGPAYFRFDVYYDFFTYWDSQAPGTVYVNTTGNLAGGHAVLVIGWDDAKNAWLCKNSWGSTAGPNGNGTFWIAYSGHVHNLYVGVANVKVKYISTQKADLVAIGAYDAGNAGYVYTSLSSGTGFPRWNWNSGSRMIDNNARVFFADINGDKHKDLIGIGAYDVGNAGFVYVSLSNGTAYPGWNWNSGGRMIDNNSRVYFTDVNGDGKSDMVGIGAYDAGNAGFVYVSLSNGSAFPGWSWNSGIKIIDRYSRVFVVE